jgi:nicotinamidase-related amidase
VQHGMTDLIISGIRTEQCCETTTRHASDLGYRVTFIPEATLTFDMKQIDGATLSANDIKSRTVTVLHQRFAQISSVDAALGYA